MKKYLFTLIFTVATLFVFGQMNYQFVILDSDDEPINTLISVQLKIRTATNTGPIEYQETHGVFTDEFGRGSLEIGLGTPVTGTYAAVPRTGKHFLEVEVDITGGSNYTFFSLSEIHPAFKADEIDPVFDASVAKNISQSDVDSWNNDQGITSETDPVFDASPAGTITQSEIDNWNAPVSGGVAKEINQANYESITIEQNDLIHLSEIITISSNYDKLDEFRLHISGGGFEGTGSQEIELQQQTVLSNMSFTNVNISGLDITFINCRFNNVGELPWNSIVLGGSFQNSTLNTSSGDLQFKNVNIVNSTIPRIHVIESCEIEDSTLGNTSYTIRVSKGNNIDNTTLYAGEIFGGNYCETTEIIINDNVSFCNIFGNRFDEEILAGSNIITVNRSSSAAQRTVKISNNLFWGDTNSSNHIKINGAYTGSSYDAIIHIIGNSFTRGDFVVDNSATGIDLIISNNVINNMDGIGVSASSTIFLISNTLIP